MFKDKVTLWILVSTVLIFLVALLFFRKVDQQKSDSQNDLVDQKKQELLSLKDDDHVRGNPQATVVLIQYLDFECPVCASYDPVIKQLIEEFGEQVLFVNRYFPLIGHKNAMNAALAAEAAHQLGQYEKMHDLLFAKQDEWGGKQFAEMDTFFTYAKEVGLEEEQFKTTMTAKETRERVERDLTAGRQLGVNSTPTFFLAGEKIPNPRNIEDFRTLINAALLKAPKIGEQALGEKTHEHIDLKVYLGNKELDLSQTKYQSTSEDEKDPNVHVHDGNGEVVHKHREGVTLGMFFKSIGISFDQNCLVLDTSERYCNDESNELRFLVNGQNDSRFANYELNDLDRVLINYGPKNENLESKINSVTDQACMYSEKCPERGTPPTEGCVGGLGTDC